MPVDNNLLIIALILLIAAVIRGISTRLKIPPVIGLLLLGVVIGPSLLKLVQYNELLHWLGEVGVLILLFEAGMETDLKRLKKDSAQALPPALGGVLLPFASGTALVMLTTGNLQEALTVGVILTATSVSVSVMTLIDLNKIKGIEGRCIVNAAIIDDIIGIILITILFAVFNDSGSGAVSNLLPFLKIIGFFVIMLILGKFIIPVIFNNLKKLMLEESVIKFCFFLLFIFAWLAEYADLAAITGAYFAGLFLGQTQSRQKIVTNFRIIGKAIFVDIFFVGIGLQFNLFDLNIHYTFVIGFILIAIISKLIGSGIGIRLTGLDNIRAFRVGSGMIPRGEVALIVANMALKQNLITQDILSATILMVIVSALITPLLLKYGFTHLQGKTFFDE